MEHGAYTGAGNLTCTGTGEPSVPATVLTLFDMFCSGLPPMAAGGLDEDREEAQGVI
jgi:hypothetical protein